MKRLHRADLFGWSVFDESRDIDFHSVLWHREHGNVIIDPLPMSEHDLAHLDKLGHVKWIVLTNSDHVRDAANLAKRTGAGIMGPRRESADFPLRCQHWLADEVEVVPGLMTMELEGSKTPGELALVLEDTTLVTGDLVRCHEAGRLCLLPDDKLSNRDLAIESVHRLSFLPAVDAVLVGDGWPIFRDGKRALEELASSLVR